MQVDPNFMDSDSEDEEDGGRHVHERDEGTDIEDGVPAKVKSKLERISASSAMEDYSADAFDSREGGNSAGRPSLERVSQGSRRSTDSCLGKRSAAGDDTPAASLVEPDVEVIPCFFGVLLVFPSCQVLLVASPRHVDII